MALSTNKRSSTKTFHKESRTTTSYQETSSVTTYYSKKVTTFSHASRSKASAHLNIQAAHRGKELRTINGTLNPPSTYVRSNGSRPDKKPSWRKGVDIRNPTIHLGDSRELFPGQARLLSKSPKRRVTISGNGFSNSGDERPAVMTGHSLENAPRDSQDTPFKPDEGTPLIGKTCDKEIEGSPTDMEKVAKDADFKQEQIKKYKARHLENILGPRKGLKTWEVKKLPVPKCKDGHSPNWFAYGANVYALDNVHRRGYLPNVYGPPEHHLEAGEIVYELDRTVDDSAVWIKHRFWSRETERWRTGWTKACWMNRVKPGGIVHMDQSYQG